MKTLNPDFIGLCTAFRPLIGKHLGIYVAMAMIAVVSSLLMASTPLMLAWIIDVVMSASEPNGLSESAWGDAVTLLLILVVVQIAATLLDIWVGVTAATKGEEIGHDLRQQTAAILLHDTMNLDQLRTVDNGMLLSLFSRDIDGLWDLLGFALTRLVSSCVLVVAFCAIVLYLNVVVGCLLVALSAILGIAFYFNGRRVRSLFGAAAPRFDKMIGFVRSLTYGYETIAAFRQQSWARERLATFSKEFTDIANSAHRRSSVILCTTGTLTVLARMTVWILCLPSLLHQGDAVVTVTLGEFLAILFYFNMVTSPLEIISTFAKALSKGAASAERLASFLKQRPLADKSRSSLEDSSIIPQADSLSLRVRDLRYYADHGKTRLLSNISFDASRGMCVGLAGQSGSGKSTLLRLLGRLFTTYAGTIELSGVNYSCIPESAFRNAVLYLPQESHIFPVNLIENLFAQREPGETASNFWKRVEKSLLCAEFPPLDNRLQATDNMCMAGLSGGELQRLCLARLFMREGSLVLVDEPTSELDLTNSVRVAEALAGLCDGKNRCIVIVASHDPSVLRHCTEVLLLADGFICDRGTHDSLLQTSSLYRRVISSQ